MPFGNLNWLFLQNLAMIMHATSSAGESAGHGANAKVGIAGATTNAANECITHSNMLLFVINSR